MSEPFIVKDEDTVIKKVKGFSSAYPNMCNLKLLPNTDGTWITIQDDVGTSMTIKLSDLSDCGYYMAIKALEQKPKYCDRNICIQNEYNGIGCVECEVTKSQEPCEDAISRKDVNEALRKCWLNGTVAYRIVDELKQKIDDLPSVQPQPKTGRWKKMVSIYDVVSGTYTRVTYTDEDKKMGNMPIYECECGRTMPMHTNYCPDCGAKMVESQESEENA